MPRLNEQQQKVIDYADEYGSITQRQAYDMLREYFLFNHARHVDEALEKLVRAKLLYKTGTGIYTHATKYEEELKKQKTLF